MLWMMPLMFGFLCLSFPSGLALYWLVSNVITIIMQYFITGWGALVPARARGPAGRDKKLKKRIALEGMHKEEAPVGADIIEPVSTQGEGLDREKPRDKRQDRGGGYSAHLRAIRRQPRKSKGHHPKRK